jgi:PAS domain S-box-containing protein
MQSFLNRQTRIKLLSFSLLTLFVIIFFLLLLRKFNRNMNQDIDVITSFFNNVLISDKPIDRQELIFYEFDKMAKEINAMFTEKIFAQQSLYAEQNALFESEEKFRNTMDSTLIGVYIIQNFKFQYVNPAMCLMFGYSKEDMVKNISPIDLVVPEQKDQVRQNLIDRETGKLKRINDIKCVRANGEIFDTMVLGAATTHKGRAASVGTMIDITERKAAEDELKRSENRATALLEAIPDMVFRMNREGVFLDVKADSKDFYVPSPDQVIDTSYKDILPPDVAELIKHQIYDTLNTGKMHTIEYQLDMENQGLLDYESRMVQSGENEVTAIVRNITERKKAAEENSTLERQLNQAKRMESIGLMAGGVAHDLNNILSGIVGYPDIILRKIAKDSELVSPVEAIRDSGMRAAAVVEDLLTVARGAASTRKIHPLNTLIKEYLAAPECTKLYSLHSNVEIKHNLNASNSNISCSEVHIKKCIMNLVTNAVEAIDGSGTVSISTNEQYINEELSHEKKLATGQYIVLAIQDDGPGISKQDIEHIFEPFYTKKSLSRSGTGLGLTVVWNTVQDHNGKIFIESSGNGTCFELYFPLEKAFEDMADKGEGDVLEIQSTGHGEHILVVDDESLLRNVACEMLTFLGYQVDSVSSGEMAIEFVRSQKVDLLLIDMLMEPGINGYETYKEINKLYPGQKAIIASGYSENKDIRATLALGAQNFIKKPYTLEQLALIVRDSLQSQ